jgi:signal transduction histidine kinase
LGLAGLMVTFSVAALALLFASRLVPVSNQYAFRGFDVPLSLAFGIVGTLIAARRPSNPIGWILCAGGIIGTTTAFGTQYVTFSASRAGGLLPLTHPIAWFQNWSWVPLVVLGGPLLFQLFPDGRTLSRRWRPLMWFTLAAIVVFSIPIASTPGRLQSVPPSIRNPYTLPAATVDALEALGGMFFMVALIASVIALIVRFRRSSGDARLQMKWLVFAGGLLALAMAAYVPIGVAGIQSGVADVLEVGTLVGIISVPIAAGVAILRYRLFDIDIVLNKALVFGALAAGISAVYVGVVVGIGAAVGTRGEPNVGSSVAATALVALAFQPLRAWARRVANRFVYGKRATPHEVLSVLGERISDAYSLDDVLPRLAQLVTEATAASRAEVWVRVGGEFRRAAAWPEDAEERMPVAATGEEISFIPGAEHVFPVRHQDEVLGALAVSAPANEPITAADERLLTDLASHAGLVLRNVRLIEELRASRQRLVSAQDQERRRIERNLHDGAQQELVALAVKVRLTRTLLATDAAQADTMLEELQGDVGGALENLRDLARGIYPPMLADNGLASALRSQAQKAALPVDVEAEAIGRYPMEVESAVYFCVLEALQNVAKYAGATKARVRLAQQNGRLEFAVIDDGAGFDVTSAKRGAGTTNMTDRLEALGGKLRIESQPGSGTTVSGELPISQASPNA